MVGKLTEQICLKPTLLDCFCGMGGVSNWIPPTIRLLKGNNVIETPICMGNERLKHPTQKPEALFEPILRHFARWVNKRYYKVCKFRHYKPLRGKQN